MLAATTSAQLSSSGERLDPFRGGHALFSARLVPERSIRELVTLVPVPQGSPRWRKPSYGLGVMADPESPLGPLFGHSGGGPGYEGSAFDATQLMPGGAPICALCAVEEDFLAENLVLDAFDLLREVR